MVVETPQEDPSAPPVSWELTELTDSAQLRAEGVALQHCVASYSHSCWTRSVEDLVTSPKARLGCPLHRHRGGGSGKKDRSSRHADSAIDGHRGRRCSSFKRGPAGRIFWLAL